MTISSAAESDDEKHAHEESKSGFSASLMSGISYGSGSQNQSQTVSSVTQVGSTISGANVSTSSGRDTTITASAVLADQNVSISAGRNIGILAAANQQTSQSDGQSSSTGIGLMPGLSGRFTAYGNNNALQNGNGTDIAQSTSLISANGGNLSMQAGLDKQYDGTGQGNVTTQGAELLAADQLSIAGNAVDLQAIHDSSTSRSHAETHSVTLGSSLTGSIGGAITRIGDMASEAQHTDNGRLQGALALKAGYDAYKLAGSMPATIAAMQSGEPNPISSGEGFGVSVNLGVSQSRQDSNNSGTESRGTTAQAGNISITSREGDIDMQAAKLQAQDIGLDAAKDINLIAAANTADLQSTNSASNAGIGATFGSNGQQTGLSFQIGGSLANGHANGTETTYDNTQISATDHLSVKSGGDVNMIGAQLAGDQVSADIGGNLNIVTLQDGSNFDSKQETGGFSLSLCIPPICVGTTVTGSINYGLQTVDHNYQSAVGQSGIAAGDGGFDLNVKGNTALTGAAITSTAPADKNSLQTASLSSSDLTNTQHTDSESVSIGISTGSIAGNVIHNALGNLNGNAAMPKNGDESSNTNSVISPAQVTITGTGDAATDAQSKANAATLTSRDASTANASLSNTLTLQQAQELQAQLQQQQENQRAADLAGAVLNNVVGDVAQKAGWADGSPEKIVLHGLAGLIEAKIGGSSAVAGVVSGMSVEAMSPILSEYLLSHGYTNDPKDADGYHAYNDMMSLGATLVGAASGALAGGDVQSAGAGGSIGLAADVNNRQLHPSEKELASRLATASNGKYTQAEIEEQMRGMSMTTNGVTEVTSVDTIIDNNLGDGGWMRAGTTIDGQPIYMQQISPEDTALRAYIINNTTNSDVPSLINYGGTYLIPSVSNTPFPIPTANCATAECAAGVLPNKSLTQQELDAMKNGTADFASWSSTQSGRVSAAAIVYATYLSTIPNPAAQAGAGIQAGIAASATLFGLSASAIEQFLRPNVGGMAIDTAGSVLGEIMGRISPIASPITNEIIEQIKNTSEANILKNFINRQAKNE
ncbi:MAG TPA: hemagglutinin repeat-containing protein [Herbaspirillum sp.]